MFAKIGASWKQLQEVSAATYPCGYCGDKVGSKEGYYAEPQTAGRKRQQSVSARPVVILHCFLRDKLFRVPSREDPLIKSLIQSQRSIMRHALALLQGLSLPPCLLAVRYLCISL